MKFIFIFRGGEESPDDEMPERMAKWGVWIDSLGDAFQDGAPLGDEARILTAPDAKPGTETIGDANTEVSGYVTCEAEDLDAAVELCRGCPINDTNGQVEIREAIIM